MKTFYKQAKANEQVMHSLSTRIDKMHEEAMRESLVQRIYGENELQTCDPEEGGPFIWQLTGVTPATAIPRG